MKKKTVVLLVVILAFCTLVVGVLGFIFFRFRAAKKQRSEQPPQPVEVINYDEKHKLESRYLYEYDDLGNLTKKTSMFKISENEYDLVTLYVNKYDEFGLLTQQLSCDLDRRPYLIEEYFYDYFGNLRKVVEKSADESEDFSCTKYRYDIAGNLIVEQHRIWESSTYYNLYYQYDQEGRLLSQSKKDLAGNLSWYNQNVYDENGLLMETIHSYPSEENGALVSYKTLYTYDDNRRCIKEVTHDASKDFFSCTEYRYD